MSKWTNYEIPQEDLMILARLCGQDEMTPQAMLPQEVVECYITDRRRADAIGLRLGHHELWGIVCRSAQGLMNETPEEQSGPDVVSLWKTGQLKRGAKVMCKWRDYTDFVVPAILLGVSDKRPVVQFTDEQYGDVSEERKLNPMCVIPEPKTQTRAKKEPATAGS